MELTDGYWGSLYAAFTSLHNQPGKGEHSRAIQWARWRPHRLCGVETEVEGRFTIPTIKRTSDKLRLNYRCRPGGWIKMEVLRNIPSRIHPDVDPVAGMTFEESDVMSGESLDHVVTWNGNSDLSGVGEMLAIRVRLFQAKIFAYHV